MQGGYSFKFDDKENVNYVSQVLKIKEEELKKSY